MYFCISKSLPGRLRLESSGFSLEEGFFIEDFFSSFPFVYQAKINETTQSVLVDYDYKKEDALDILLSEFKKATISPMENEERRREIELQNTVETKILRSVLIRYTGKLFFPYWLFKTITSLKAIPYICRGLKKILQREMSVDILDGAAISIALLTDEYATASSTMFLLEMSHTLEDFTTKKTKINLAKSLEINIDQALLVAEDGSESFVPASHIKKNQKVRITEGNIIAFDGRVVDGLGCVDESKMTGETKEAIKKPGTYVFAGTVLESGNIVVEVENPMKSSRIAEIIEAIENSEKSKSQIVLNSGKLADKIVPFSFIGAGLVYLFTRNLTKTASVLMVDYSCAIKLMAPLAVISAIKTASDNSIAIKGGVFLETIKDANTFLFDKTGTLTESSPEVIGVETFYGFDKTEFIRDIACIEEHFHHPVGLAIVSYADDLGITHKEKHAEVQYIVAHGIETKLDGKKVRVGSYHYIFEDNEAIISEENHDHIRNLATSYSIIYMSYDNVVRGYVKLEDPARPEAIDMVKDLKARGVENIVMVTGDSKHAAENVSKLLGLSDFYYGVLPDTKAEIVKKYKETGKVVMIGDGINDSLALSTADVSISLKDASDLARETADIILLKQDLADLGKLIDLSNEMAARIDKNFAKIIAINTSLLGLGLFGILMPQTTALIHNLSTLLIGLDSSKKYKIN